MSHPAKVTAALSMLAATGMSRHSYAPPLHCAFWRLGMRVPPPHFAGFGFNLLYFGSVFAILWGVLMSSWTADGAPQYAVIARAVSMGVLLGIAMSGFYSWGADKHKLPLWSEVADAEV